VAGCAKAPTNENLLSANPTTNIVGVEVDDARFKRAELVIIGKAITSGQGSKYYWQLVERDRELKNSTGISVSNILDVAHLIEEPEIPKTNSIIYLKRYAGSNHWRLITTNLNTLE
jgi:hypothetical protein